MNHTLIAALKSVLAKANTYYHGSRADFDEFTKLGTGKHGKGFYFTPDFKEARLYANTLAGDGTRNDPRVFTVKLKFKKPYNTMSVPDASEVAEYFGLVYRPPKFAGGAKEHYHALEKQLKKAVNVKKDGLNEAIVQAGCDALEYELMKHIVVFDPKQIKVTKVEKV